MIENNIDFGNNILAKQVFDELLQQVNKEGYPLLRHYQGDLVSDAKWLKEHFGPTSKAIMTVRLCGTWLSFAGIDVVSNRSVRAQLESSQRESIPCEHFLLSAQGAKKITLDQAYDALKQPIYDLKDGKVVSPQGVALASCSVDAYSKPGDGNHYARVRYESARPLNTLSLGQLLDLRIFALGRAVMAWSSLFARVTDITINGVDMHLLIEQRRAQEACEKAAA